MRGLRTGLPSKALSLLTMPKQPRRARSSRAISTATQSSTRGRGRGRTTRARSRSTSPSGLTPPPPAVDTPSFDPELLSQMLGAIRVEVAAGFEAQRPPAPPQPLPPPVSGMVHRIHSCLCAKSSMFMSGGHICRISLGHHNSRQAIACRQQAFLPIHTWRGLRQVHAPWSYSSA